MGSFKIGRPRSREWENVGRRWTEGWEVLKIRYVYRPLKKTAGLKPKIN